MSDSNASPAEGGSGPLNPNTPPDEVVETTPYTGPVGYDPDQVVSNLPAKIEPGSVEHITRNLAKFRKLNEIVPLLTEWRDWIAYPAGEYGERAWPTRYACERLAGAAGVSIKKDLDQMGGRAYIKRWEEDEKGRYYIIEIHAYAELAGHHKLPVIGMCTSRHQLFGQRGADADGTPLYKALHEIRETDIVKTAYTDLMRQAVHRLVGVGNIDAERLDTVYGRRVPRVSFRTGQAAQTQEEFDSDQKGRKRLWAILLGVKQGVHTEATKLLEQLTTFQVDDEANPGKKKTIPGVKDVAKLKAKRLSYALKDAEKRLDDFCKKFPDKADVLRAEVSKHEGGGGE
jgi:hypothetical protein